MTPSPHLDDDRLSALLDGEATTADVRHAETCPDCAALLAAWRNAVGQLAKLPPPAAASQRDAAAQAALAAAAEASEDTPVLLDGRRRRGGAFSRNRVVAGIAAALVVAGIAVGVSQAGGGGSGQSSTAAGTTNPAAAPSQSQASAGAGPAPLGGSSISSIDLGVVQDQAQLVAVLRARVQSQTAGPTPATSPPATAARPSSCQTQAAEAAQAASPRVPVLQASLAYRGVAAQAFVFPAGERDTAAVVGRQGCRLLVVVSF